MQRPCDVFLQQRGCLLGDHHYEADPHLVEIAAAGFVFYHFTCHEKIDRIMTDGLAAIQKIVTRGAVPEFEGCNEISGFLEPFPSWLKQSRYFGDFIFQHLKNKIGSLLVRIEVPHDFPGIFVRDYAFQMEFLYHRRHGKQALELDLDFSNWNEELQATAHSYLPIGEYRGGHIAPVVSIVREGEGIAVPPEFISVCDLQPLQ